MKGVVKFARGDGFVELRDVAELPPAPNQVKIEVKAAGICGSDLHIYHDDINIPIRTPVVIGHEFSGMVVEKGSEVGEEIEWQRAFEMVEKKEGMKLILLPE